jgi:hypothetical protein
VGLKKNCPPPHFFIQYKVWGLRKKERWDIKHKKIVGTKIVIGQKDRQTDRQNRTDKGRI